MIIKELIAKRIAIQCDTEEQAKQFLQECEKANISIQWASRCDDKLTSQTHWQAHRQDSCYAIDGEHFLWWDCSYNWLAKGYAILNFKAFYNSNENKFIDRRIAELEKTLADKQAVFQTMTNEINSVGFELNALALILDMRDCKTQIAELKMIKGKASNEK